MTTSGLIVSNLRSALVGPFDFSVARGMCMAITGPSGSGKSLLLRMIADLDPNEGDVSLDDSSRAKMFAAHWRRCVVYLAADSGWWVEDVGSHFKDAKPDDVTDLFDRLGLKQELLHGPVARLSTGERQRASLIRGLLLAPSVLLLDEPTSALDQESTERVEAILKQRMTDGTSVVIVTHDDRQAQRLATHRFRMNAGKLELA